MVKIRKNFNSSPEFLKKLRKMQGRIQAETGEKISLTKVADELMETKSFVDAEEQMINNKTNKSNVNLKFDRRFR